MQDKASGRTYFVNTKSKVTTWKISETDFASAPEDTAVDAAKPSSPGGSAASVVPAPGEVRGDWKAMLDKASGRTYYVNTKTKVTTWKVVETDFASDANSPSVAAATNPAASAGVPASGSVKGDWKAVKDEKSGKTYYVNTKTKVTTWKIAETSFAA
jgi:hypothetical protein